VKLRPVEFLHILHTLRPLPREAQQVPQRLHLVISPPLLEHSAYIQTFFRGLHPSAGLLPLRLLPLLPRRRRLPLRLPLRLRGLGLRVDTCARVVGVECAVHAAELSLARLLPYGRSYLEHDFWRALGATGANGQVGLAVEDLLPCKILTEFQNSQKTRLSSQENRFFLFTPKSYTFCCEQTRKVEKML
jgi:hypothetical protein